jgi:hypothetical protein
MTKGTNGKNILGLCIFAAAIFLGAALVLRQIIAVQKAKVELAIERASAAPSPVPLKMEATVKLETIPREPEGEDDLQKYEGEKIEPGLLQIFSMGEMLPQRKVVGVEYVQSVKFRREVGAGRVLADVFLFNDSSEPVKPRFRLMLFNAKARYLGGDTVYYVKDEISPGEKKIETLKLPHGPVGVAFYEVRKID